MRGVFPPIAEIPEKGSDGVAFEGERRWRRAPFLDRRGEKDGPGLEVDTIDVERDEFAGAEPRLIGEGDDRLVSVLQIRGTGVGETLVAEPFGRGRRGRCRSRERPVLV